MVEKKAMIRKSLMDLEQWVESHNYTGYEPFDGLSSYLRILTFGNCLLERILQQLVRQSPINLRPLLGITPQESTKGSGYMAWGYLNMYQLTGDNRYKEKAIERFDWLAANKSPRYVKHSWGNHFDYASRGGKLPRHESTIVWTSLIGQAFLDAYGVLKEIKYLEIANSICEWILSVPREKTYQGSCLSYVAPKTHSVHNSNMLGAAMLARTSSITGDSSALEVAREAMLYSCSRQNKDGSWYYGDDVKYHWVDNFHTGYKLDSLKCYNDYSGDASFEGNLWRGLEYYKNTFFEDSGRPRYYNSRPYPIDIQCASQAIDTLSLFSEHDPSLSEVAGRVAIWTIRNMQDPDGHFCYRVYPAGIKAKAPMIHWGQATMYKALSSLLKLKKS